MIIFLILLREWQIIICFNLLGLDNRLQLGDQICLKGKKKLTGKRITGFQVVISSLLSFFDSLFYFLHNRCLCSCIDHVVVHFSVLPK